MVVCEAWSLATSWLYDLEQLLSLPSGAKVKKEEPGVLESCFLLEKTDVGVPAVMESLI